MHKGPDAGKVINYKVLIVASGQNSFLVLDYVTFSIFWLLEFLDNPECQHLEIGQLRTANFVMMRTVLTVVLVI